MESDTNFMGYCVIGVYIDGSRQSNGHQSVQYFPVENYTGGHNFNRFHLFRSHLP